MEYKAIRSALFVPATKTSWIDKAAASPADFVIVDLEDAVGEELKTEARDSLKRYLADNPERRVLVRTNSAESSHFYADIQFCKETPGVVGIMLPKAESHRHLEMAALANKPVIPLIESAKGVVNLYEICRHIRVDRISLGTLDLSLSVGLANGSLEEVYHHNWVRAQIATATAAFGLNPALDGVYPDITDSQGLEKHIQRAKNFGFGGVLCIHPTQVQSVLEVYKPNPEELVWARRVVEAMERGDGAVALDGQMIDAPVLARAQRLLSS